MAERSRLPSSKLGPDISSATKSSESKTPAEKDSEADQSPKKPTPKDTDQNVVMADRIRLSTEADTELSFPTPPKKSRNEEESSELKTYMQAELPKEIEGKVLKLSESSSESETLETPDLEKQESPLEKTEAAAGTAGTSEEATRVGEKIEKALDTQEKSVPSGSSVKKEILGTFESLVEVKVNKQNPSDKKTPEEIASIQIQTSLMGEHALYQDLSLIGNGAYGTVYKAKDVKSGQVVALKKVRVPLTEDGLPTSTLREIAALKQLDRFEHPHIVRLLDVCQGNYLQLPSGSTERSERVDRAGLTLWLVFEHVDKDLASYISSCTRPNLPPETVKRMSNEILQAVDFLHSHRIIHRDLKPQNLLVTREEHIKIADFGLAKTYDFEMRLTSVVVTQWYRAPEVLLGCSYATPVDMWSVGCIIAELCRLEPLFPGTSEGDQLDKIFQVIGTPDQKEWPEDVSLSWTAFPYRQPKPLEAIIPDLNEYGLDLLKNIFVFNPHKRITAAQALKHQYFTTDS